MVVGEHSGDTDIVVRSIINFNDSVKSSSLAWAVCYIKKKCNFQF